MKRLGSIDLSTHEGVDINLSPLIDMVFLLLIFFMVTTVFVEQTGIEVQTPRAASGEALARDALLIGIEPDGQLMAHGQPLRLNSVRALVARELRHRQVPVVVQADASVPTGRLIEVVDECRLAGARQVSVATELPEGGGR